MTMGTPQGMMTPQQYDQQEADSRRALEAQIAQMDAYLKDKYGPGTGGDLSTQVASKMRAQAALQLQNQRYSGQAAEAGSDNFAYRGAGAAADADLARYRQMGADAQGRQGVAVDYGQADQSRGSQQDALGLYANAAYGRGPSVAQAQFQQGLDASARNAMSVAASQRGGGLQRAAAMRQGMMVAGDMGQNAAAQAAALRAQEMQQAMQGYAGLSGQMRGMDAQQAQTQAQFYDAQRARNDQMQMGLEGYGQNIAQMQQSGGIARESAKMGNTGMLLSEAARVQAAADAKNARMMGIGMGIVGAAGAVAAPMAAAGLAGRAASAGASPPPQTPYAGPGGGYQSNGVNWGGTY